MNGFHGWVVFSVYGIAARVRQSTVERMQKRSVFISHSARDADWVRSFAEALGQRGVTVWLDGLDDRTSEPAVDELEAGFRSSDLLVALLDADSSLSPNLFFELGAAIGMGKRVLAIVPRAVDPSDLPLKMRLWRYLVRDTPELTAEELSSGLQGLGAEGCFLPSD
ncbi:MAG: toll/interleukin-1 receptor domain-containing protein [Bryobacteraceae bacterium]